MTFQSVRVDLAGGSAPDRSYDIVVGQGLLAGVGDRLAACDATRAVVIADTAVAGTHGRAVREGRTRRELLLARGRDPQGGGLVRREGPAGEVGVEALGRAVGARSRGDAARDGGDQESAKALKRELDELGVPPLPKPEPEKANKPSK